MAETYKIGDYVVLSSTRPRGWTTFIDEYLGKIVEITYVGGRTFNWLGNVRGYTFELTDIVRKATDEEIKEVIRKEEIKKQEFKEKYKHYIFETDKLEKLAISVFGNDRVYIEDKNDHIYLYIHFPEINITNSLEQKHLIKDLYTRFSFTVRKNNFETSGYKLNLSFAGRRSSLSLKEYESSYRHSHLQSGQNTFTEFCLGSSDYSLLLQSLRIEPIEDNWMMVLLGLENYLAWESLEGGPYMTIDNLKYSNNKSGSELAAEAKRLAGGIPNVCWEFISSKFGLIPNHPLLYNYFDKNSIIRNLYAYSKEEAKAAAKQATRELNGYSLNWKGKDINMRVYVEDEADGDNTLSREVVVKYCEILSEESVKFLKNSQYERGKERNEKRVFGKIRA